MRSEKLLSFYATPPSVLLCKGIHWVMENISGGIVGGVNDRGCEYIL